MGGSTAVKSFSEIDFSRLNWKIPVERYTSADVQERERALI